MVESTSQSKSNGKQDSNRSKRRSSLSKILPTDRLSFSKQVDILRAAAVASEAADKGVFSNNDVADIVGMAESTIYMTNAFFCDVGLLKRHEGGFLASPELLSFHKTSEWNPKTAGSKLTPLAGC